MALDETRTAGEKGHLSDHNSLHDFYNAAVTAGVFDESTGTYKDTYPSLVTPNILIGGTGLNHSGWGAVALDTGCIHNGRRSASGADGSWFEVDVLLPAGTWQLTVLHLTNSNAGIIDVLLDGTEVASFDTYSGSIARNVITALTGITVADSGLHTVRLIVDGKNASSTDFQANVQSLTFRKTA